ncbi:MAG: non-hydrolyzing UDP-N-acetylglucosamine 2-epimerase, partial [Terrimicrobiaceae bacterium]
LGSLFEKTRIDAVLVQGDTTTAFVGGMCAFYHKIPVGHVEAGLRSHDRYSPFPEELNRQMLGRLSSWHFAPTAHSAGLLTAENIHNNDIFVCGNTVVDALHWMVGRAGLAPPALRIPSGLEKMVLVTCHRRENLGTPMRNVAEAVRRLSEEHDSVYFVVPMHPNPAVRDIIIPVLGNRPNVSLCEPLDYDGFLGVLKQAYLVLSDSGGVQEEATALGKPVLVLRRETERPEGVEAGTLRLVGTDADDIVAEASDLLLNRRAYEKMTTGSSIFGDGHASKRIVRILEEKLLDHCAPSGIPWSFAATNSASVSMTSN